MECLECQCSNLLDIDDNPEGVKCFMCEDCGAEQSEEEAGLLDDVHMFLSLGGQTALHRLHFASGVAPQLWSPHLGSEPT